jgi:uncharacterized membrane protein YfhO
MYCVTLDQEAFKDGYDKLKKDSLNVTEFEDTSIKGTINASEDGVLYTSINYDTGWSVYIDGEKVSSSDIVSIGNDALLGVNITAGEHTVEFKYMPEGLILGMLISITALILMLLVCSMIKTGIFEFKPKLYEEEETDEAEDAKENEIVTEEIIIDEEADENQSEE